MDFGVSMTYESRCGFLFCWDIQLSPHLWLKKYF